LVSKGARGGSGGVRPQRLGLPAFAILAVAAAARLLRVGQVEPRSARTGSWSSGGKRLCDRLLGKDPTMPCDAAPFPGARSPIPPAARDGRRARGEGASQEVRQRYVVSLTLIVLFLIYFE